MNRNEAQIVLERIMREMSLIRDRISKAQNRLLTLEGDAESIKRAWALLGDGEPLEGAKPPIVAVELVAPQTFAEAKQISERRGELIRRVREIIAEMKDGVEFSSDRIKATLYERYPNLVNQSSKSAVAVTLRQLEKNGEILVTYKGSGRAHSRYQKAKTTQLAAQFGMSA